VVFTSAVSLYKAMGGGWVTDAEHMTSTTYDGTTAMANPAAAATQTKGPAP
jgi:multidrug efflux system outer membrane protein